MLQSQPEVIPQHQSPGNSQADDFKWCQLLGAAESVENVRTMKNLFTFGLKEVGTQSPDFATH